MSAVVVVFGWLVGPLNWWRKNRRLLQLIRKRREFILVYNPVTGASKTVVFLDGGQIGDGMNDHEHTWQVRRGALEFLAADGKLWNRFKLDQAGGRLVDTADLDVRSLYGQYLFPQHQELSRSK